jgi:hypothetical protein
VIREVAVHDPRADADEVGDEYGLELLSSLDGAIYDVQSFWPKKLVDKRFSRTRHEPRPNQAAEYVIGAILRISESTFGWFLQIVEPYTMLFLTEGSEETSNSEVQLLC